MSFAGASTRIRGEKMGGRAFRPAGRGFLEKAMASIKRVSPRRAAFIADFAAFRGARGPIRRPKAARAHHRIAL
jgi:hypothetical protein